MAIKSPAHLNEQKAATRSQGSFFSPGVQAKLTVNQPGDAYEQEADSVADQVMRMPETSKPAQTEKPIASAEKPPTPIEIQRLVAPPSSPTPIAPVQTQVATPTPPAASNTIQTTPSVQGEIQELSQENEKENTPDSVFRKTKMYAPAQNDSSPAHQGLIQRNIASPDLGTKEEPDEPAIMRKSEAPAAGNNSAPSIVSDVVQAGGGKPMDPNTSGFMESRFGHDFSNVRIHQDSKAAESARSINALAYTSGNNIVFDSGRYQPNTGEGRHLLAHELTHTIQQGGKVGNVQRALKSFNSTSPSDLEKDYTNEGYITKNNNGYAEFYINKLDAPKYDLLGHDTNWVNDHIKAKGALQLPKDRKTNQAKIWKNEVREEGAKNLKKLVEGTQIPKGGLPYKAFLNPKNKTQDGSPKTKGLVGTIDQLINELIKPFWSCFGKSQFYEIEHIVDFQIAGEIKEKGKSRVDDITNLILLEEKENKSVGQTVKNETLQQIKKILEHYKGIYSDLPNDAPSVKKNYTIKILDLNLKGEKLNWEDYYFHEELKLSEQETTPGAPFKKELITIKEEQIPSDHFLLTTSDKRAAYIIPYDATNNRIGAFNVTVVKKPNNNLNELESIEITYDLENNTKIEATNFKKEKIKVDKQETDRYVIESKTVKSSLGPKLKGLAFEGLSPIIINEEDIQINGFDVSVKGRIDSTLSILEGVNIKFFLENQDFTVQATVPLDAISKNIPKPFEVQYCDLIIQASTKSGLFLGGGMGFRIGKFGQGQISAGYSSQNGVVFDGNFHFDSKWFNPAEIEVSYKKGQWSIGGKIGIEEGVVTGIKKAKLTVGYSSGVFSAAGDAELDVPGIDKVKLAAEYSESGGFIFKAGVDLKKMTGIKSGSVTVTVVSKGDDLKLGIIGTAEPDFPSVPNLNTQLSISYLDGVFEVKTRVDYTKGRFTGSLEVGVTNKAVNELGVPQTTVPKPKEVVVFGFGQLEVDIFKGNKGRVSVRLSPEREVFVAGGILFQNLSPFGDGIDFKKEIIKFPSIKIPIFGVPGMSIFFEISGGAYFTFNWQPLLLKRLEVTLQEVNINQLESAQIDVKGSVGSIAKAEAYMEIKASLGAEVLIAQIRGSLGGSAGIGVQAEAGGEISAGWNHEKGLQLKEIIARVAINPYAVFRLTGSLSVDLDLWLTTINLYYKEWVLAEGQADLSGISLNVEFPIRFNDNGDLEKIDYDQLKVQQPEFSGDQGKQVLSKGINGEEEPSRDKEKVRAQIKKDMRESTDDENFTPSKYSKKMQEKYKRDPEMQEFVRVSVEDEARLMEYEQFEKFKNEIRPIGIPAQRKKPFLFIFGLFHSKVNPADIDQFMAELIFEEQEKIRIEEERKKAELLAEQKRLEEQRAAEIKAAKEKEAREKEARQKAAKLKATKERLARQKAEQKLAEEKEAAELKNLPEAGEKQINRPTNGQAKLLEENEREIVLLEKEIAEAANSPLPPKPVKVEQPKKEKEPEQQKEKKEKEEAEKIPYKSKVEEPDQDSPSAVGKLEAEPAPESASRQPDSKPQPTASNEAKQVGKETFFQPIPVSSTEPKTGGSIPGTGGSGGFSSSDKQIEFSPAAAPQTESKAESKTQNTKETGEENLKPAQKLGETPPETEPDLVPAGSTNNPMENQQSNQLSYAEDALAPEAEPVEEGPEATS